MQKLEKQFHIHCKAGDVGRYCILPGDPGRCKAIAALFDDAQFVSSNREFTIYTGTLLGEKVSVCSTGIGGPSASIAMEELHNIGADTFLRVGTCGGIHLDVQSGDIVIATGAIRFEHTSREYAPIEYPAVADFQVTTALVEAARESGHRYHTGVSQCKDAFYGQHSPARMPVSYELLNKWEAWKRLGVKASEMESAALFVVADALGCRCGSCFHVIWNQEREAAGLDQKMTEDTSTYFISGHALKPIGKFSDKIEEVQAQNLADSRIEENNVKELNQLSVSYNKMLERLSDAFDIQRQFTANAAHELRTPLSLMQIQLDSYNSNPHPGNDADTEQTIKMVTEQNDRLDKMVKTLLDMSELQTVGRDDVIMVNALVDEVLADLEPLAQEKNIKLIGKCTDIRMIGSDILIYRMVYNLVENAIKYNHSGGRVTVTAYQKEKHIYLSIEDTGNGIPEELRQRVFEPFFRVDKSRSRELGGVGLGLALVHEIVSAHDGTITVRSNPSGGTIFDVSFTQ